MSQFLLAVAFGEMEISPLTIGLLIALSVFMFSAVGITTLRMFRFGPDEED